MQNDRRKKKKRQEQQREGKIKTTKMQTHSCANVFMERKTDRMFNINALWILKKNMSEKDEMELRANWWKIG